MTYVVIMIRDVKKRIVVIMTYVVIMINGVKNESSCRIPGVIITRLVSMT